MSKLSSSDEPTHLPSRYMGGSVLRHNRRGGSLHPEEIEKRLADKSIEEMPKTGWHWPFGWLIILFCADKTKRYIDVPSSKSHAEASKIRDEMMEFDDVDGTLLIRKTYEKK